MCVYICVCKEEGGERYVVVVIRYECIFIQNIIMVSKKKLKKKMSYGGGIVILVIIDSGIDIIDG